MQKQTTPDSVKDYIVGFIKEKKLGEDPLFLEIKPSKGSVSGECFENVKRYVALNGGSIQYGWIIWEIPDMYVESEFHAVWKGKKGEYLDITPTVDGEKNILFVPDPVRKYTGEPVDAIRKELVEDPYLKLLVESGEEKFKITKKNYELHGEKFNKKVGRNHPCPCGSDKKYKKCCLNSKE